MRTYQVYELVVEGKARFATEMRIDGYWVQTCLSKNRRQAERKGRDHVAAIRQRDRTAARATPSYEKKPKTNAIGLIWIGESA